MSEEVASCPLCSSRQSLPCWKEDTLSVDYSGEFKTDVNQYLTCEACGLIYLWPRPSVDVLRDYYASIPVSQVSKRVSEDYKEPEYERTVDFILSNLCLDDGNIIEVGTATGNLLRRLAHQSGAHAIGIEASKECCDFAKEHFGIEMINGQLEDLELDEMGLAESADLVLCCNTLEHIVEPARFLRKLGSMVKPSGFLYVEVPSTRILATFSNPRYGRNIHHLHLNHFLASNLSSACERVGLVPLVLQDDIGTDYPSLKALFSKQNPAAMAADLFHRQVDVQKDSDRQAVDICAALLEASQEEIVLWGAGQDLFYVLRDNPGMFPSDCVALVDRNPHKQGKDYWGLKVKDPGEIDWDRVSSIIITPSNQQLQIHIREDIDRVCPSNTTCSLMYPVPDTTGSCGS